MIVSLSMIPYNLVSRNQSELLASLKNMSLLPHNSPEQETIFIFIEPLMDVNMLAS